MALKKSTIISENSDAPKAPKSRHYIDNKAFLAALVERKNIVDAALAAGEDKPRISEYIGECVLQIAQNLAKKRNFVNYRYKEEMIMDGVLVCIKYLDNFDPAKSKNPFSYFTQICTFAFISRITGEKKQTYVKFKKTINSAVMGELANSENEESEHIMDNFEFQNDYMEQFIDEFEKKKESPPPKKKGVEKFIEPDETEE